MVGSRYDQIVSLWRATTILVTNRSMCGTNRIHCDSHHSHDGLDCRRHYSHCCHYHHHHHHFLLLLLVIMIVLVFFVVCFVVVVVFFVVLVVVVLVVLSCNTFLFQKYIRPW